MYLKAIDGRTEDPAPPVSATCGLDTFKSSTFILPVGSTPVVFEVVCNDAYQSRRQLK
jgi:hypothetical protein